MTREDAHLHAVGSRAAPDAHAAHADLENALFEVKRVIVGQEAMLERVIVALLAGGHVLLEGVPGLAKTLTVKTVADALGGSFKRSEERRVGQECRSRRSPNHSKKKLQTDIIHQI